MTKRRSTNKALFLTVSVGMYGCAHSTIHQPTTQWLADGSVGFYRAVPPASVPQLDTSTLSAFHGGLPSLTRQVRAPGIQFKRSSHTLILSHPVQGNLSIPFSGTLPASIPAATTIVLKQRSPSWYAPDSYFQRRGLPVPHALAKERYRKGALGHLAFFLSGGFPVHTSRTEDPDVGGIRLSEQSGETLFSLVDSGIAATIVP